MKFKKLIKEVKGDLSISDQIILPGSQHVWTIDNDENGYFSAINNTTGEKTMISKFNLANIKKIPIFEFKTQDEKTEEVKRYKDKIKDLKRKLDSFKANSRESEKYKAIEKDLDRTLAALNAIQKTTPYMTIY